jgi:hypothetical protein
MVSLVIACDPCQRKRHRRDDSTATAGTELGTQAEGFSIRSHMLKMTLVRGHGAW